MMVLLQDFFTKTGTELLFTAIITIILLLITYIFDKKLLFIIIFSLICYTISISIYGINAQNEFVENRIPDLISEKENFGNDTETPVAKNKKEMSKVQHKNPVNAEKYVQSIQKEIKKNWIVPTQVKKQVLHSTTVKTFFTINRQGEFSNIKIIKTSGVEALDKTMIEAIKLSSGKTPLPDALPETVNIEFTFEYNVFGSN